MKKATRFLLGIFTFSILISGMAMAQPTLDGTISSNEYGSHTDGQNAYSSDGRTWYMSWDDTNLYLATSSYTNGADALVIYVDIDDLTPINSGSNSNGTNTGTGYDSVTPDLPFRADFFLFVDSGYNDYKTDNGSGGWGTSTTGTLTTNYSDANDVLEVQIPWSAITGSGRPSSFNLVGFMSYDGGGGGTFAEIPNENPAGTSADLVRYFAIDKTASGDKDYPFDNNSYVHIGANESSFGSISVYDFTMNTSSGSITRNSSASNNWTIENDLVVSDGTINFNSTSSTTSTEKIQVSGGTLTLSGSGATSADNVTFSSGTLTTNSGLNINSGGSFYQTGGTLTGNVNMNRAISGDAGWRLLSLPKTGGTVADISDDTPVQGVTGGDDAGATDTNFILYQSGSSFSEPTNVSTAWGDGFGFGLYFFNNTTNGSATLPVTLDASGSEPSSDVNVTLNTTASGSTAGSGAASSKYTLVGNPFSSNYDINQMTFTGDGIQNNVQFWNDGSNTYATGDRSSAFIVAPWQGFWVEVSSSQTTSALAFPTSGKTSSSTTATYFSKQVNNRGDISFKLTSETTNDEALKIAFREAATTEYDIDDASKFVPLIANYATMAIDNNGYLKSVESLPYNLEEEVTLSLQPQIVGVSGEFTFGWNGLETIPSEWELILHDYDTGASIDMRSQSEYVFSAGAQAKANPNPLSLLTGPAAVAMKSKAENNRFGITIRPTTVSNETEDSPEVFALEQNYPNPFNPSTTISYSVQEAGAVNISVYNLMGQKVATLVNETKAAGQYNVRWNASGAASGMYYYRLEAGGQSITRKMTLIK